MQLDPRAGVWVGQRPSAGPCRRCGAPAFVIVAETAEGRPEGPWCGLGCWGAYHDDASFIHGTLRPPAANLPVPAWDVVVGRWPASGPPGLTPTRDRRGNVLLYRDLDGALRGVLWRRAGGLGVLVDPDHRREGIGRALVRAAGRRWPIDLGAQPVSAAGAGLTRAALPREP